MAEAEVAVAEMEAAETAEVARVAAAVAGGSPHCVRRCACVSKGTEVVST